MLAAQAPTMIVMVETTTSEVRSKRGIADGSHNHLLGDTGTLTPKSWSDKQVNRLLHFSSSIHDNNPYTQLDVNFICCLMNSTLVSKYMTAQNKQFHSNIQDVSKGQNT